MRLHTIQTEIRSIKYTKTESGDAVCSAEEWRTSVAYSRRALVRRDSMENWIMKEGLWCIAAVGCHKYSELVVFIWNQRRRRSGNIIINILAPRYPRMSRLIIYITRSSKGSIIEMRYSPTPSICLSSIGPCILYLSLGFCHLRFFIKALTWIPSFKIPTNRHGVYPIARRPPTYAKDFPL